MVICGSIVGFFEQMHLPPSSLGIQRANQGFYSGKNYKKRCQNSQEGRGQTYGKLCNNIII
jgi:hypothetical protein